MCIYVPVRTGMDKHGDLRCHEGFPHGGAQCMAGDRSCRTVIDPEL